MSTIFHHSLAPAAAFACACAITLPASAGFFKMPVWRAVDVPRVVEVPKSVEVPKEPLAVPDKSQIPEKPQVGNTTTPQTIVPECCHHPNIQLIRKILLEFSYHPTAVDSITDPNRRARIANSLQHQNIYTIAAFSGRERQFGYVVRTAKIHWMRNELFEGTILPNARFKAKPSDADIMYSADIIQELALTHATRVHDRAVQIGIQNELEAYLSEASDRVSPSDFATEAQYEKVLKSQLAAMLDAEKKSDKPRFSFDVVSGKLEMPALVSTGWLEIKAGEVDIYELAGYAAQIVFSSSSVNTATQKSDDPPTARNAAPAAPVVQNEERNRRELVRSLAPSDLPYAKSIAADLFTQAS